MKKTRSYTHLSLIDKVEKLVALYFDLQKKENQSFTRRDLSTLPLQNELSAFTTNLIRKLLKYFLEYKCSVVFGQTPFDLLVA